MSPVLNTKELDPSQKDHKIGSDDFYANTLPNQTARTRFPILQPWLGQ